MSDVPSAQIALPQRRVASFGWKPDLPDRRDLLLQNEPPLPALPTGLRKFSLRQRDPEAPYDQGALGSCTAQGIAYCVQFERAKRGFDSERPSRLFIYYYERLMEGSVNEDAGAQIRDGMKVVARYGAPPETSWPYDPDRFREQPPAIASTQGQTHQVIRYLRTARDLDVIKRCIYAGFPIVMGFTVYESFAGSTVAGGEATSVDKTGLMPMPQRNEEILGGHCVVWMGWDDDLHMPNTSNPGALETRNSWGTAWGDSGYFWMPTEYGLDRGLSSDFWTVRSVEAPVAA